MIMIKKNKKNKKAKGIKKCVIKRRARDNKALIKP